MIGNKVIKALECCGNKDAKCNECVFYGNEWCRVTLAKESLRIINRLKAENKNCGEKILNQREQLKACNEKIKGQQAEIERLNAKIDNYKHLDIILNTAIDKLSAEIKTEACKEFAERLKAMKFTEDTISADEVVYVEDIDNLLKEMEYE